MHIAISRESYIEAMTSIVDYEKDNFTFKRCKRTEKGLNRIVDEVGLKKDLIRIEEGPKQDRSRI